MAPSLGRRRLFGTRLAAKLMLLAACLTWADAFVTPQQLGELPGEHVEVTSPAEFISALRNPIVAFIHVTEDLYMDESAWPKHAIRIGRNLTVESSEHDMRLINYTRVGGKIMVEPTMQLTFRNLIMSGLSIGSALQFIKASPDATVSLVGGMFKTPVCPPFGRKMAAHLALHPRPPGCPGLQRLGPSSRAFCIKNTCWTHGYRIIDWASAQPLVSDAEELGAYTALMVNLNWACDTQFTDACVALKGYEICRKEMYAQYLRGVSNTYDGRARLAAMVLTAVACVAVAVGFAYTLRRLHKTGALGGKGGSQTGTVSELSSQGTQRHASHYSDEKERSVLGLSRGQTPMGHFDGEGSLNNVQLGSVLGAGSFGCVYKASWQRQVVAVKIIPHDRQTSDKICSEADLSLSVVHPNVVRTFHHFTVSEGELSLKSPVGSSPSAQLQGNLINLPPVEQDPNGQFFHFSGNSSQPFMCTLGEPRRTWIIQELCDLGALPQHLSSVAARMPDGNLDPVITLGYALDVALGMAYLHELNICHGDLKASNTLLMTHPVASERATVKVSDFGLSRVMAENRTHLSTHTIGTITHMPPELLLDGLLTRECDVYSFGILMWELATGQALYSKMNPVQIMNKVITEDARPVFPPHVADEYINLARECWARSAKTRPAFSEVVVRLKGMLKRNKKQHGHTAQHL